jgi:eukaryotic-like serine/threonine-protein kinase
MTPERWQQVKGLVDRALQLNPEGRGAFLDGACSSDRELRAEIDVLLSEEDMVRSGFLQSPPWLDPMGADGDGGEAEKSGLRGGQFFAERFQLIRKLGEGGMGQVWLAEQTSPVRRTVALKLIRSGVYDQLVMKRFQAERQSLAIMDHPTIAKVFDAGATPQGQPYFVMEYVPGLPITHYCDEKKLRIEDRLELFIQVCEGVQHAHQKAIIHRDLKPANILVTEVDGKPVPRIIDFGLAKPTMPQLDGEMFTQVGHFVGTPGYMSPEQADPSAEDIDTRTDVYSLGAVLYVLLAGSQPFEAKPGEKLRLDELLRKLREEEPPRPSAKVSGDRDGSTANAGARGTGPKQLVSLLRGDLDWITMKAIEKDRARRYGTPSELAADIRRYLNHEAVVARPASTGYRLRKYVRRHRATVIAAAGVVLLLAAFSILQTVQLRRTIRERDRANRETDQATRVTDFMTGMFKVSDPSNARGNSVTAREILDKASNDIGSGLAKDPQAQAEMLQVMASTYENLGLYGRAHELAKRALDSRVRVLGDEAPATLESKDQLGWILAREGHDEEAEKLERQALAGETRLSKEGNVLTARTMDHLAVVLLHRGHYQDSEKLARQCIDLDTRVLGPENPQTLEATNHLGAAILTERNYPEAERVYRRLVARELRVLGPDHPETLKAQANLAIAVQRQGRNAEAEQLYRDALLAHKRVFGQEHQNTVRVMESLAILLALEVHTSDSEKLFREVWAIRSRTLGPEHPDTLNAEANLSELLMTPRRLREAKRLQREVLAARVRVLGPANPATLQSQSDLANILIRQRRYAEAEKIAREAYNVEKDALGFTSPLTVDTLQQLGIAMTHDHRYPEAAKLFRDAMSKDANSSRFEVWYAFACVAAAANRPDDALQYLQEAVNRGYKDAGGMADDDNLRSLRGNSRFQELILRLRQQAPASQKALVVSGL